MASPDGRGPPRTRSKSRKPGARRTQTPAKRVQQQQKTQTVTKSETKKKQQEEKKVAKTQKVIPMNNSHSHDEAGHEAVEQQQKKSADDGIVQMSSAAFDKQPEEAEEPQLVDLRKRTRAVVKRVARSQAQLAGSGEGGWGDGLFRLFTSAWSYLPSVSSLSSGSDWETAARLGEEMRNGE